MKLQLARCPREVVNVCDKASRYVSIMVGYDLNSGGIANPRLVCYGMVQSPRLMVFGW